MGSHWAVFGVALIPAFGNFLGGVLGELVPMSKHGLSLALHTAAGVVLGLVAVEVVPQAHEEEDSRLATVCFIGGFALFMLLSLYVGA